MEDAKTSIEIHPDPIKQYLEIWEDMKNVRQRYLQYLLEDNNKVVDYIPKKKTYCLGVDCASKQYMVVLGFLSYVQKNDNICRTI